MWCPRHTGQFGVQCRRSAGSGLWSSGRPGGAPLGLANAGTGAALWMVFGEVN